MRNIFFTIFAVTAALSITALVYINEAILPDKIKTALVEGIGQATGKRIEISSARLDLFKGLVIKDLVILDKDLWLITAKEADCRFLVIPLFRKQIVITSLKLESARVFVERGKDGSINIVETFFKNPVIFNRDYNLTISRIILHRSYINFKDSSLEPPFTKDIKNASVDLRLSLPDKITFNAEFEIPSKLSMLFKSYGEYSILKKELSLNIKAKDVYLKEFEPYCKSNNIILPEGRVDTQADIKVRGDQLRADIDMTSLGLEFLQDRIKANLNCALKASAQYDFTKKTLIYSGGVDIKNLALSGLEYIEKIDDIRGKAIFTESKFLSENLTCTVAGLAIIAKADLTDFKSGDLNIDIKSSVELRSLGDILKNKFKIKLPADITGPGKLNLKLAYKFPIKELPVVNGYVDLSKARAILDYNKTPLDDVNGRLKFTANQLQWSDIEFTHKDMAYTSSGTLTNFEAPGIDLKLDSQKLSLRSLLAVNGNFLTLTRFEGRYENFEFSIYGDLDTMDPSNLTADIHGIARFDLSRSGLDVKIKNSSPSGRVALKFALKGNVNDLNSCVISAEASSDRISLYGYKMDDFKMSYIQRRGIMDIVSIHSSLYGASLSATGSIDFVSKDTPYQINAEVKNLRISDIKKDTALRDYDISGLVQSRFGVKGYSNDVSRLSAWGNIVISEGKLWQLNLFRGIGTLIFRKDFSSVIFKEGECDFFIKDKTISVNDINLRSDLINITGVARIGFDNSVNASLKTEFTDEGIDAGKMTGVSAAIERYSIVEVTGTLKEPVVKVKPDLSNVVSDIAQNLFQR